MSGQSATGGGEDIITEKVITVERRIGSKQAILIVEDSPEDFEATRRAFRKCGLENPIYHSPDGEEAIDFLFRRSGFSAPKNAPRPALILLDLNLPGTDGREVLAVVKQDETLRKIPVIVLTTSSNESDIEECYIAGANRYIVKPVSHDGFMDAIKRLTDFWFRIAVVPKASEESV